MRIIDASTHITPIEYTRRLSTSKNKPARDAARTVIRLSERYRHFSDVNERLAAMDRYGYSSEVTMVHSIIEPNIFDFTSQEKFDLCQGLNSELSSLSRDSGRRLFALASVPLESPEMCENEMERSMKKLGLKGFMVPTNVMGKPLDSFEHFWSKAESLDATVYVHPVDPSGMEHRTYEREYDLAHVFGWPYETTLTLTRLALAGILKRHPNLKVVAHHMGGMIPFFMGRIKESYSKAGSAVNDAGERLLGSSPQEYLMKLYYDTAVGGSEPSLKCGLQTFGAERIIFATDFPWGPKGGIDRISSYPEHMYRLDLSAEELNRIFYVNVEKLILT
ncbi:MAG: amidohydrolase [Nitrososphaerota archaeon]|nr:amidohydrolase [Nitrososphaerota archaeon]